jgi:DNA-binding transcriptional LysR family regulator
MVQTVQRAARGEIGHLTVAFVGSAMYGPLPAALRSFRSRFPGVHLLLDEMETSLQRRALLERRIDVGLLRAPLRDAELASDILLTEPIIVALPKGHPLARKPELKLPTLANEPFVLFPHGPEPSYADVVLKACAAAGFRPRGEQETTEMQTAISLVSAGFGLCLVPAAVRHLRRPGVVYRPLAAPSPTIHLVAAYRRENHNPALTEILRTVRG